MKVSLAAARVNAKKTQAEVADIMGISKTTIVAWENNKTQPGVKEFIELCKIYNCSMDDICFPVKST